MCKSVDMNKEADLAELHAELEQKYGPAVAQGIIDDLQPRRPIAAAPDYMDVKAMSEVQEQARVRANAAIASLRAWRAGQMSALDRNLIVLEGARLRRDCENAIALYRLSTRRYFAMYRAALDAAMTPSCPVPARWLAA